MKIAGFNTKVVSVPREVGPLAEGPGATTASFVVLTIKTDDGIEGIGYAGFASTLMLKALKAAVDSLAEQTIGDDPMMIVTTVKHSVETGSFFTGMTRPASEHERVKFR